jgi:hypothetical protein
MKWRNRIAQGFSPGFSPGLGNQKARPEGRPKMRRGMRWFEIGADVLQTFARHEDPVVVEPHPSRPPS